jgi:hypothetical protein
VPGEIDNHVTTCPGKRFNQMYKNSHCFECSFGSSDVPSPFEPTTFRGTLFAVLAVVASCLVGCVNLTEPWQHGADSGGVVGAGGGQESETGEIIAGTGGAAGGSAGAAGGSGGLPDDGPAGAGGSLGAGGAGEPIDSLMGGAGGGATDAPMGGAGGIGGTGGLGGMGEPIDGSVNSEGGAAGSIDAAPSGTGGVATGGTSGGTGGSAIGGTGGAAAGGAGGTAVVDAVPPTPDGGTLAGLVVHYACDETSGAVLHDTSGTSPANDGTLKDSPPTPLDGGALTPGYVFGTGRVGSGALLLVGGSSGYVSMPSGILDGATEMTLATWVKVTSTKAWERLFDIGSSSNATSNIPGATTNTYMNLVVANDTGLPSFAITSSGRNNEQTLTGSTAFPTGDWTHVAVVLGGGTGTLYINGTVAAAGTITLGPANLGTIGYAYIGKSWFTSDPHFDGQIDDVRIYSRALSEGDILALKNGP